MTDACSNVPFAERNLQQSASQPCQECPWRTVNRGRSHPDQAPYTDDWLTMKWRRVSQEGTAFACHLFDGGALHHSGEIEAAGFKKAADIGERKECAGMVAMVRRELEAIFANPSFEAYQQSRPYGLSKAGLDYFLARIRGDVQPPLRTSDYTDMAEILDMHDVVKGNSLTWTYDATFLNNLNGLILTLEPKLRECGCEVCAEHHTVHDMIPLHTAEGLDVDVDAELHPLLLALAAAGIRTTASCIDIHEAIEAISPDMIDPLMNLADPDTINYGPVMRRRAAFIELRNDAQPEALFIAALELFEGVEVTPANSRVQMIFDRDQVPTLTELAGLTAKFVADQNRPKPKRALRKPVPATSKQDLARKLVAIRKPGTDA